MKTETANTNLISYCGFYCGACPNFKKDKCEGCKGDSVKCAVGFKSCKVRPCCIENGYSSCAECEQYDSVKSCKLYNPFMVNFFQFLMSSRRRKGIEMIKEKGEEVFAAFMHDKNWVTIKIRKAR
jgi:hypothetical protein